MAYAMVGYQWQHYCNNRRSKYEWKTVTKKTKVELDALLECGVLARFVENQRQSGMTSRWSQPSSSSIAMLAIGTAFLVDPALTKGWVLTIVERLQYAPCFGIYICHHNMELIWTALLDILECIDVAIIDIDEHASREFNRITYTGSPVKHGGV